MPTLWRYLLSQYLRVLILSSFAFIAILMVMRLDEVAHFATLGANGLAILQFVLYQIPYILPIALPISSLIAVTLLIQRLSQSYELTALRASGFSLKAILAPILLTAAFLSLVNFYVVSEVATDSHLTSGLLKTELRAVNPLLLARHKHLMRLKGFYFDSLGPSHAGESASDAILAIPNKKTNRLNLLVAKEFKAEPLTFTGNGVTIITSLGKAEENQFDSLMLENIQTATTSIDDFSQLIQKKVSTVNNDHLRLPLLLVRLDEDHQALMRAKSNQAPESEIKQISRSISRGNSEIVRRISVALAVFTFTLMGAAFGISISRNRSSRGLYVVIGLAALYLMAFFAAKGMEHVFPTAASLYLLPHVLIVGLSLWALRRSACGIE